MWMFFLAAGASKSHNGPHGGKAKPDAPLRRIEQRLRELEVAVRALSQFPELHSEFETTTMQRELVMDAETRALVSIVRELAGRAGVSREGFDEHFRIRLLYWIEELLLRAGDHDPDLGERLADGISLEGGPESSNIPSLFDPPTTEGANGD
jgi:hypothetical protein